MGSSTSPEPQKIPLVLSPEEVQRLLAAAPGFKYRLLLSLTYGCGLRASEVVSLKVCDIDSAQMVSGRASMPTSWMLFRRRASAVINDAGSLSAFPSTPPTRLP
jgi:site-specific recombinase XerC